MRWRLGIQGKKGCLLIAGAGEGPRLSVVYQRSPGVNQARQYLSALSGVESLCLSGLISALLLLLMEYDSRLYLLSNYCGVTNHPSVPGAALKALIRPPVRWN